MRQKTCQNQSRTTRRLTPALGRSGFSIMEVMGVVVVVSVLSGFVLQPLAGHQGKMALAASVQDVAGAQKQARSSALRDGQLAELHINASAGQFWVETQNARTGVRDTIGTVRTLNSAVTVSTDATLLCFDSRGIAATGTTGAGATCDSPSATLVFTNGNLADTLQFTALGRVAR